MLLAIMRLSNLKPTSIGFSLLVFLACFLGVGNAQAYNIELDPYLRVEASRIETDIAGVDFNPGVLKGVLGLFVWQGVALEVQAGFADEEGEDKDTQINTGVSSYQAALIRLQSPTERGWSAFVNLGYAQFDLNSYSQGGSSRFEEGLSSAIAGLGFEKSLNRLPRLSYALSYEHVFEDDLVSVSAINFAYRYRFGDQ
jgi:hypothetical protein